MRWTPDNQYLNAPFDTEAQLKAAIVDAAAKVRDLNFKYLAECKRRNHHRPLRPRRHHHLRPEPRERRR